MAVSMRVIVEKFERYKNIKEKADSLSDWNDIVHDLNDLVSNFGSDLPSDLKDKIDIIMDYTEPPNTELTEDIDSVKSGMEDAIDFSQQVNANSNSPSNNHHRMSKAEIIMLGIGIALVIASSLAFYVTQYSVSTMNIVNANCTPLQFQNIDQPFTLVKLPHEPIYQGGHARVLLPAGTITLDNDSGKELRIAYLFGQSVELDLAENTSAIEVNGVASVLADHLSMEAQKDDMNTVTIRCL